MLGVVFFPVCVLCLEFVGSWLYLVLFLIRLCIVPGFGVLYFVFVVLLFV